MVRRNAVSRGNNALVRARTGWLPESAREISAAQAAEARGQSGGARRELGVSAASDRSGTQRRTSSAAASIRATRGRPAHFVAERKVERDPPASPSLPAYLRRQGLRRRPRRVIDHHRFRADAEDAAAPSGTEAESCDWRWSASGSQTASDLARAGALPAEPVSRTCSTGATQPGSLYGCLETVTGGGKERRQESDRGRRRPAPRGGLLGLRRRRARCWRSPDAW